MGLLAVQAGCQARLSSLRRQHSPLLDTAQRASTVAGRLAPDLAGQGRLSLALQLGKAHFKQVCVGHTVLWGFCSQGTCSDICQDFLMGEHGSSCCVPHAWLQTRTLDAAAKMFELVVAGDSTEQLQAVNAFMEPLWNKEVR